jgi:hypothetical protein
VRQKAPFIGHLVALALVWYSPDAPALSSLVRRRRVASRERASTGWNECRFRNETERPQDGLLSGLTAERVSFAR